MNGIDVEFSCGPIAPTHAASVEGREAMDALSHWVVRLAATGDLDLESVLHAPAQLTLIDHGERSSRTLKLLVVHAATEIGSRGLFHELTLADPEYLLRLRRGYRIFQQSTTPEIVTTVLTTAGVPASAVVQRLSDAYPVRMQCVQYAESEWDFIERLLSEDGISYWFETVDGEARMLLGDSTGSHDGIDGSPTVRFRAGQGGHQRDLLDLAWEEGVAVDRVLVRDFDVRQPDVYIDGSAGDGPLEHFEYPANLTEPAAAQPRAQRRLEQLQRDRVRVTGRSHNVRLKPGRMLEIVGGGSELFEQRMLVSEVRHSYRSSHQRAEGPHYTNEVVLRPTRDGAGAERPTFRPPLRAHAGVEHLETAVTSGPGGEEIHVDDLGRVKLKFFWDRSGISDDRSSYWTRCLQYPLGASMFLPRVGWEVAVAYLDGLPERPFVLGRLYNATSVTPYALPAASATTAFQSWSTPGGGTTQEIKMSDDAGGQLFQVHAARDLSVKVGGTHTTAVDGNEEHSIGLNLTNVIAGTQTASVGGTQSVDVGKQIVLSVAGSNTERIGAGEFINVTGNRAVLAEGSYVELIGAAYGIACNQSNTNTTGAFTRVVGGNKALAAAIGVTESVAGARTYICRGARTITVSTAYAESAAGGKNSIAGAVEEKAVDVGHQSSFGKRAAGSAAIQASGKLSLTAATMTIEVSGALLAETLDLSGGKLKVKGGMAEISGDTHRVRGGEVGG